MTQSAVQNKKTKKKKNKKKKTQPTTAIVNTAPPKVEQVKKKEKLSDRESDTSMAEQDTIQQIAEELGKIPDAKQMQEPLGRL